MTQFSSQNGVVGVQVSYPDKWYVSTSCVPSLVVPRELFAISNQPIIPTPTDSEQPRPMVQNLAPGDMFVWCYSQRSDDPDPSNPDAIPDYTKYSLPLQYQESEVFPSTDAREWDASAFLWRRIGIMAGETAVTVWVWEGTRATAALISQAQAALASLTLL